MKIWNLTASQARNAMPNGLEFRESSESGIKVPTVSGRIIPSDAGPSKKARFCRHNGPRQMFGFEGDKGRWVRACCYHGFRDGITALFNAGATRVQSTQGDWRNLDDFRSQLPSIKRDTATLKNGYGQVVVTVSCNCPRDEVEITTIDTNSVTVTMIQPSICPFVIMVPEHYRPDGSCKCDDREHRAMMVAEWDYSASDFASIPLRETAHNG